MSAPLEMTEAQELALAEMLLSCGSTRGCERGDADKVFAHVRDMVLEAAAASFEAGGANDVSNDNAWWFIDRLREMKGSL